MRYPEAGSEPRATRQTLGARPACGSTDMQSGGDGVRRPKLEQASLCAERRRATAPRRWGASPLEFGGRRGGRAALRAVRWQRARPETAGSKRTAVRPHRGAPWAERPNFWGAATAVEKCGAKAST